MTTVVIADDDLLVREGLVSVLGLAGDIEVAAACADADALMAAVERCSPDVVVTDIRMPPGRGDEGLAVARRLRRERPGVGVVVVSAHVEPAYAIALLEDGAVGRAYLVKERVARPAVLADAVREVARGGSVIDPAVVEALVEDRVRARRSPLAALTPRELEILGEIAQGRSNAAIAAGLFLTKRAVEKHVNAIFAKLGLRADDDAVDRRVRAALLFLSEGPAGAPAG